MVNENSSSGCGVFFGPDVMSHYGCANNCVCTTGFCLGLPISSLVLSFGLRLVQPLARGVASCLLMASSNPELDPVQTREVAPTTADT